MTTKILKLSLTLLVCFVFAGLLHASNVINKNVYALYCDNIGGATLDDSDFGPNRIHQDNWSNLQMAEIESDPLEGKHCFRFTRQSTWGGWAFRFDSTAGSYRNMSSYYGGAIEFWVRTTDINNAETADYEVGVQFSGGEEWFTLGSLNFSSATSGWQKVSVPLTSPRFNTVKLSSVSASFAMRHGAWTCPIDVDAIAWKKPGFENENSARTFFAEIKSRVGGTSASSITWSNPVVGSGWQASDQYIELYLDRDKYYTDISNNNWSIRIYVNNGLGGDGYTGSLTTSTIAGLVSSSSDTIVPMMFRVASKDLDVIGPNEVFVNAEWMYTYWGEMRNYSLSNPVDSVKVWDSRQGFHWNFYDTDFLPYGDLTNDKILRIYFIANFQSAQHGLGYRTNTITVECVNE